MHDKTNKLTCAQRILRPTWASAQSDQSFRCPREESLGIGYPLSAQRRLRSAWASTAKTLIRLGALMPRLIWVFAGRTGHFVGFVMRRLIYEPRHNITCLRVCDQLRLKLACSATETRLGLEISAIASRGIVLSRQRTTKAVCGCACWSSVWN